MSGGAFDNILAFESEFGIEGIISCGVGSIGSIIIENIAM